MRGMQANVFAPEWLAGGPAETPQGYVDENVEYSTTVTLTANQTIYNNPILIDGAYEVRIDRITFAIADQTNTSGFAARFRGGDGRLINADFLQVLPLTVSDPTIPFLPNLAFAAGETFQVDLSNQNAATLIVQVVIKGIRRRPAQPGESPTVACQKFVPFWAQYAEPAPGCHWEDYDFFYELDVTALQQFRQIPLPMDPDAQFYLRCFTSKPYGTHSAMVRITDPYGELLTSDFLQVELFVGANGRGAPVWPEVVCPPNSVFYLDLNETAGDTYTFSICLRGVKLVGGLC